MSKKVGKFLDSYYLHSTVNLPETESVPFKTGLNLLTLLFCRPGGGRLHFFRIHIYNTPWKENIPHEGRQRTFKHNIYARSRNHCCRGKERIITYSESRF